VILVRVTFSPFDTSIQNKSAILAFEAIRMVIFAESSQTWSLDLAFTWDDGSFTSCATISLFLGVVVRAVNALLFIHDELIMRQVFLANHTSEAFWMESGTVGPHHMASDLFVAPWTFVALSPIMFFAEVFIVQAVTRANDRLATVVTLFRPQFIISFTYGLTLIGEVLASKSLTAYKAAHASGMVELLSGFDAIPLNWLLAHATLLHNFLVILCAIRLPVLLKELSVNASFANAALKALFVVHLAKSCAAFNCHWFHAHPTFTNGFLHSLGLPITNLGLNLWIIEIGIGTLRSVVVGLVSRIRGNGPVNLRRWDSATG